jgi:hypothetical protein
MRKLAFSFHLSGARARRGRWLALPPAPFHGWLCTASRLRQHGAMLRETLPTPPREGVTVVRGLPPLRRMA